MQFAQGVRVRFANASQRTTSQLMKRGTSAVRKAEFILHIVFALAV